MGNLIITISRCYGSGGRSIGKMISEKADIPFYDRNLFYLASSGGIRPDILSLHDETLYKGRADIPSENSQYISKAEIFRTQSDLIRKVAAEGDCVIIGRCADNILKNSKHRLLRVFVWAPEHVCIRTVAKKFCVTEAEAAKTVRKINQHRADYYRYHTRTEWNQAQNFDLCLDTSRYTYQQAADAILGYASVLNSL